MNTGAPPFSERMAEFLFREQPLSGILRNTLFGLVIGFVLFLIQPLIGSYYGGTPAGYLIAGSTIAYTGWACERLWRTTLGPMMSAPFSWIAYCSRVPLWFMAGGIAYVLGLLCAKKIGMLEVYDIPIKPLFHFGGKFGIALQTLVHAVFFLLVLRKRKPAA